MEDSSDNIVSYGSLGDSYQGTINYIEANFIISTAMAIPSGHPSTITLEPKPQSPNIIPSDEDSISSQAPLPTSINIDYPPQPSTKVTPIEPRDATLHKNYIKPLSILTINLVHRDATNLSPIPPSSTPSPFKNRTQFNSLNLHRIFGCRKSAIKNTSPQQPM